MRDSSLFLGTDDRKQINSWCGVLLATEDKGGGNVLTIFLQEHSSPDK